MAKHFQPPTLAGIKPGGDLLWCFCTGKDTVVDFDTAVNNIHKLGLPIKHVWKGENYDKWRRETSDIMLGITTSSFKGAEHGMAKAAETITTLNVNAVIVIYNADNARAADKLCEAFLKYSQVYAVRHEALYDVDDQDNGLAVFASYWLGKPVAKHPDVPESEIATGLLQFEQPEVRTEPVFDFKSMLTQLSEKVYGLAASRGQYDSKPAIAPLLMHTIGEVNEAHIAFADNRRAEPDDIKVLEDLLADGNAQVFRKYFKNSVKSTFEDELADIMLMVLSISGYYGIDIGKHVALKHAYNELRTEHSSANFYDK